MSKRSVVVALLCLSRIQVAVADTVDDYVRAEMKSRRIPGIAVAVLKSGEVVKRQSYGSASIELDVPVTDDTVFILASLTKTFTSAAVLMLADEGKLALDDSVSKYVPGVAAAWKPVTIRHCLSHTSGLPDSVGDGERWIAWTRDELFRRLEALPVRAPGEVSRYNQTGYVLLGMVVAEVSGMSFEEFVKKRILGPLGMLNTRFGDQRDIVPGRASMYSRLEPSEDRLGMLWPKGASQPVVAKDRLFAAIGYLYAPFTYTAAGLNSSIRDMAKWDAALGRGAVIKKANLDLLAVPYKLNNGKEAPQGLGWLVRTINGHRTIAFSGGAAVAHLRLPDDRLSVIVLTNLQGADPNGLALGIAQIYVPELKATQR